MNQGIEAKRPTGRRGALAALAAVVLLAVLQPKTVLAEDGFELSDYRGKVVYLDFWASWCVPCRRSFPWMNDMHDKYGEKDLVVVAVNLDNDPHSAQEFLTEFPPRFKIHYDSNKSLAREFDVVAMPSSYLLDREGNIVNKHFGFKVKQQDEYEAAIVAALKGE